jgi:hypothetical protein
MNYKTLALVLAGILIGCGAGNAARAFAQQFPPSPAAPKWQQFCEKLDVDEEKDLQRIREVGLAGWEVVSAAPFAPHSHGLYCFKRPAP